MCNTTRQRAFQFWHSSNIYKFLPLNEYETHEFCHRWALKQLHLSRDSTWKLLKKLSRVKKGQISWKTNEYILLFARITKIGPKNKVFQSATIFSYPQISKIKACFKILRKIGQSLLCIKSSFMEHQSKKKRRHACNWNIHSFTKIVCDKP